MDHLNSLFFQLLDLIQFKHMISIATRRNPHDYNGYGCFFGAGGYGTAVDGVDR